VIIVKGFLNEISSKILPG